MGKPTINHLFLTLLYDQRGNYLYSIEHLAMVESMIVKYCKPILRDPSWQYKDSYYGMDSYKML
jgi:hypothetical protein